MTKEKDQAPSEEPKDQPASSNVATAVLDKPKEFQDEDKVIVLHGWEKALPEERHFIDRTLFKGGVAHNVPYAIAKHWVKGTRPDGKQDQVYGKVNVHILPANATETDFMNATGGKRSTMKQIAAELDGVDIRALFEQMGTERARKLIEGLSNHLPKHMQRGT